jgi:hypothetical protein
MGVSNTTYVGGKLAATSRTRLQEMLLVRDVLDEQLQQLAAEIKSKKDRKRRLGPTLRAG